MCLFTNIWVSVTQTTFSVSVSNVVVNLRRRINVNRKLKFISGGLNSTALLMQLFPCVD